ncbi:hypothetical protein [Acetobacter persici]|uniref:hypothetical protein n=1 Tax=Acetobacter persici TaxID=1076596 RepID=UPI001F2BB3EA|nr:hypothetical protein [Acetobacter persici]MCG0997008.1 hypothetical protein [Acetobacter persici]
MSREQDQIRALLDEARQCEQESKACATQGNFSRATDLQACADFFKNLAKKHTQITGKPLCA